MNIYEIKEITPQRLLEVWEDSVRATRHFLSDAEVKRIREYVPQAISGVSHLIAAGTAPEPPSAFMGIEGNRLGMLFVSPAERGKELGRQLLDYGIRNLSVQEITVNEQNPQAVGFYEHMGFRTYKRTDHDEEGGPYPLLYMTL